jgi:hypothetical protein
MGPEFARGYSALWESAPTKTPPRAWAAAPGRWCTPEMDRRPEPRTRSRQTKLWRGPGSPFCLVEQGYGVCGARDERPHAGQQQQLVDQLVHDVLPQGRLRQNHNWEQELWFPMTCGPGASLRSHTAVFPGPITGVELPGSNLGEQWPSRLVATAAENRLSIQNWFRKPGGCPPGEGAVGESRGRRMGVRESMRTDIRVLYCFHRNNDDWKCEAVHTSQPIRP